MIKYNYEIELKKLKCLNAAKIEMMAYYALDEIEYITEHLIFFINLTTKDNIFELSLPESIHHINLKSLLKTFNDDTQ